MGTFDSYSLTRADFEIRRTSSAVGRSWWSKSRCRRCVDGRYMRRRRWRSCRR